MICSALERIILTRTMAASFFPELYEPFLMDLKPAFSKKKTQPSRY